MLEDQRFVNISINHDCLCMHAGSFLHSFSNKRVEEKREVSYHYGEMAKKFTFCTVLQSVQEDDLWSLEKMQAYFCHVKSLKPTMTEAANQYVH